MWISGRTQYGLRALVELAKYEYTTVSLRTIATNQNISLNYLEHIMATLRDAGYVEAIRGAQGGYRISKPIHEISTLAIVELLEGSIAPVSCIEDETSCAQVGQCSTEGLWNRVDQAVRSVLAQATLADLVDKQDLIQLESVPDHLSN